MTGAVTPESGRIMTCRSGIVTVRGPIQPVTPGQLVLLLHFYQRFDLISCRGHSRGWGRWRNCRIARTGPGITSRITSGWLIVRASARIRAGGISEIQRRGDSLKTPQGKMTQFRSLSCVSCPFDKLNQFSSALVTGILSNLWVISQ